MEEKIILDKIHKATQNVNEIVKEEIFTLPYFDATNFSKNIKTLQKVLLDEYITYNGNPLSLALYNSYNNTIYISKQMFNKSLARTILHELIHMFSTDRDNNIIGYACGENLRMFNEAATQWLALKVFNGSNIKDNDNYIESVILFDQLVNKYGEEKMYFGFFKADFNLFINKFDEGEKKEILSYIDKMNEFNICDTLKLDKENKTK